jgi:hypothetical protein
MMNKELVLYHTSNSLDAAAQIIDVIRGFGLSFREVLVDRDPEAMGRVLYWTGKANVPTVVAAQPGRITPYAEPQPVAPRTRRDHADLGSLIAGPDRKQLEDWLIRQHFIMG